MALGEYVDRLSRAHPGKGRFLRRQTTSDCATNSSSSTSTSVDGRQSPPSFSLELAPSNSTVPLTSDGGAYFTVNTDNVKPATIAAVSEETSRLTEGQKTKANLAHTRRKRSTTALLLKPGTWTSHWRRIVGVICGRSLDGAKKRPPFRLPSCQERTLSPNCLMALGACISFMLIISAYLMGRFLSSACDSDCPANKYQDFHGNKSYLDYAYALLRDQLVISRKSKPINRLTPIVRLGRDVVPVHYDLHLDLTDLTKRKLRGTVRISIDCLVSTDSFLLHASHEHLSISKMTISRSERRQSQSNVYWNLTSEWMGGDGFSTVNLTLDTPLQSGVRYDLSIVYTATICSGKSGVNCYDNDQRGPSSYGSMYVSTKFEPTAARTLLPCFDEPDLKATFNVTIVRLSDMVVITNSPTWKRIRTRHAQV